MQIKQTNNKLDLKTSVENLVSLQLRKNNFALLYLYPNHVYELDVQPLYKEHSDPFDRTLIAQCRVEKLTLLTVDTQIRDREYGIQTFW
jgi:PIN domain nuclease of toxin-antitoxin system